MADRSPETSAGLGHRGGGEESAFRIVLDAVRDAPTKARRVLVLNVVAGVFAIAIAAIDNLGDGTGPVLRLAGLTIGFVGIFLITLAYILHHVSQDMSAACSRISFYRLEYRELHGIFRGLPVVAVVAAACLAAATAVYGVYAIEEPVLLIVVLLFAANLALAVRSVGQTSRFLYAHAREQAEAAERARAQAVEAQLAALQAQLNPHFLFNALNTVASLVRTDAPAAEAAVENLAEVLRRTLARTRRQWTTLREELDYLKAYVAIEQERWGQRLRVDWRVEPEALELPLPPMTLQPLVENALRHGIGNRIEGGRIEVSAERRNGRLTLAVRDNGVGFPARHREGTGLGNLRQRIRTLYGEDSQLTIESADAGTCVTVTLPIGDGGTG